MEVGRPKRRSLLDRINAWLVARLPSRRDVTNVELTPEGLRAYGPNRDELVRWDSIDEIVVTRAEQLVGNTLLLVLRLHDGRALTVTEDSSSWDSLTRALPAQFPAAVPYERWAPTLAVSERPAPVTIFRR